MRVRKKFRTSLLQRAATQAGSGRHCRWAADGKQPPGENQGPAFHRPALLGGLGLSLLGASRRRVAYQ
jgi:hypothetical protein